MIFVKPALATCPVCIVAVGGGLAIAEKLGVDDLIAAIWIGALITASAIAFAPKMTRINKIFLNKISQKNKFLTLEVSWTIISYLLTIVTLQIQGTLNNPTCKIWGVCKVWLGITVGTITIWLGAIIDKFLRSKNNGKVFFPFQKVALPFVATLIASLIFYLLIC
ncbi:MAG: hypothetical protein ABID04_03170 [Patescibacteria group bacterium]